MFGCGFGQGYYSAGPWLYIMMGIRFIIFAAIIVLAIKMFKRYTFNNKSALAALDQKYVNGEISDEEYRTKKEFLRKNS